jgi:antitoxin ParD1/3/4
MEIVLTREMEELVQQRVASGAYSSPSEVVDNSLRLLKQHEEVQRIRLEELRQEILLGLEGESVPLDIEAIIAEAERRLEQRKNNGAR